MSREELKMVWLELALELNKARDNRERWGLPVSDILMLEKAERMAFTRYLMAKE